MQHYSARSPEERRLHPEQGIKLDRRLAFMAPGSYAREVAQRVFSGVMADGFIHAGNLAYLSILTLFPFFIVAAAIARLFGRAPKPGCPPRAVPSWSEPGRKELHKRMR